MSFYVKNADPAFARRELQKMGYGDPELEKTMASLRAVEVFDPDIPCAPEPSEKREAHMRHLSMLADVHQAHLDPIKGDPVAQMAREHPGDPALYGIKPSKRQCVEPIDTRGWTDL